MLLCVVVFLSSCASEEQTSKSSSGSASEGGSASAPAKKKEETRVQERTHTPETQKKETATATTVQPEEEDSEQSTSESSSAPEEEAAAEFSGFYATSTVTRIVDGDTVDISPAVEGKTRVRLIGVDTPETRDPDCGKQPYSDQAKAFTTAQLQGQEVGLEFDVERTDRYERLLAYVYPDEEEMFNETLLREGYAQVATFRTNVMYVDRFLAAQ